MSNRITWLPSTDSVASYRILSGASSGGPFSLMVTVNHNISGSNYDAANGTFFYVDGLGTVSSWYELTAVDTLGTASLPSAPFQAGTNTISSLTSFSKVKAYLGITASITTDDTLLAGLVAAASRWFCARTGQPIAETYYTDTFDGDDTRDHIVDVGPLVSVVSLTIDGSPVSARTSTSGTGYFTDSDAVRLSSDLSFTKGKGNISLVYLAGYNPVPEDVEQAVIEWTAFIYRNRTRVGVMGSSVGGENVTYQTNSVPFSVQSVVDAWTRNLI